MSLGGYGVDDQSHVVAFALAEDEEWRIGRPLQRRVLDHEVHALDRLPVEVKPSPLNAPAGVSLGARQAAGHQHVDHLQSRRHPRARHPALRHLRNLLARSGAFAEQRLARLDRLLGRWLAVYGAGYLPGQRPLGRAVAGVARLLRHHGRDAVEGQKGEELEVALDVAVVGIDPELVEVVRAGAFRIEPDVSCFALSELGSGGGGDQGKDQAVHLPPFAPFHQVAAGRDVAPLVAAADLKLAALRTEQVQVVVGLDQHVAEFGVGNAGLHPALDRVLLEHVADREMLAGVAQKVHQADAPQPVGVVPHSRRVGPLEGEEPGELLTDALCVAIDLLEVHHRALGPLAARVADHAGAATHQRDRDMAVPLQPGQPHHRDHVADVERVGGGIEARVGDDGAGAEPLVEAGRDVLNEAARGQQFEKIGHRRQSYPLETGLATG